MKFSITYLLLALITLLFLFTRLYKISDVPASVYWDEASIGYNAFSVAQTGKDEWGEAFPIHFRAFGEFKLPVYIYATVVSVKLFGLNEFSVRLPAVLFSLGVIFLTFFLAKKLFESVLIGIISSFFTAISPWFFIFSRTGYEATAGLMFYLLGVIFLLHKMNGKFFLLSVLSFILSVYSYNSFRIISPLTIFILLIFKFHEIKSILKKDYIYVGLSVVLLFLSFLQILRLYKYDSGISRLSVVSAPVSSYFNNYLSHFNPDFLFFHGDKNLRSQQPDFGQLLLEDLVFLPLGLLFLIKRKSKYSFLPLVLLLLAPIPAALTRESPHALRSISVVPFMAIISAAGVFNLFKFFKSKRAILVSIILIYLGFFSNYFFSFLNTYSFFSSKDWQYGYREIVNLISNKAAGYDRVIISDEYAQPYIFALFYQKFDPESFRRTVGRNSVDQWGFSTVSSFDKFEFGKVAKLYKSDSKSTLIFASKDEKLPSLAPVGMIKFLDGATAFLIYRQ